MAPFSYMIFYCLFAWNLPQALEAYSKCQPNGFPRVRNLPREVDILLSSSNLLTKSRTRSVRALISRISTRHNFSRTRRTLRTVSKHPNSNARSVTWCQPGNRTKSPNRFNVCWIIQGRFQSRKASLSFTAPFKPCEKNQGLWVSRSFWG